MFILEDIHNVVEPFWWIGICKFARTRINVSILVDQKSNQYWNDMMVFFCFSRSKSHFKNSLSILNPHSLSLNRRMISFTVGGNLWYLAFTLLIWSVFCNDSLWLIRTWVMPALPWRYPCSNKLTVYARLSEWLLCNGSFCNNIILLGLTKLRGKQQIVQSIDFPLYM